MFHDRNQELERLSQALWEDAEEPEEELDDEEEYDEEEYDDEYDEEFDEEFDDEYEEFDDQEALAAVSVRAYNNDRTDADLEELSDEVYYASKSPLTVFLILAGLCAMAACLVLVLVLLRHYGLL